MSRSKENPPARVYGSPATLEELRLPRNRVDALIGMKRLFDTAVRFEVEVVFSEGELSEAKVQGKWQIYGGSQEKYSTDETVYFAQYAPHIANSLQWKNAAETCERLIRGSKFGYFDFPTDSRDKIIPSPQTVVDRNCIPAGSLRWAVACLQCRDGSFGTFHVPTRLSFDNANAMSVRLIDEIVRLSYASATTLAGSLPSPTVASLPIEFIESLKGQYSTFANAIARSPEGIPLNNLADMFGWESVDNSANGLRVRFNEKLQQAGIQVEVYRHDNAMKIKFKKY